jgi:hypothetical protein
MSKARDIADSNLDNLTVDTNTLVTDSTNNRVGIGTSSPEGTLHVENASNNSIIMDAPANRYNSIGFQTAGVDKWWLGRADSDQISGDAFFIGIDNGNATDAGGLSNKLVINQSGNVGVGGSAVTTTSGYDGATLHLRKGSSSGGSSIRMTNDNTGHTSSDGILISQWSNQNGYFYNLEAASLLFGTSNTERMRIDSSGNLGVGTSSLSNGVKTVIQGSQTGGAAATSGTTQTYGLLRLQGTTFTSALDMGTNGGNYAWIQSTDQTNLGTNYSLAINPNGGSVGIGTSNFNATYNPKLQITSDQNDGTGGVLIQNYLPTLTLEDISGGAATSQIQQDQTNMLFKNNGSERMRIDSSGNVGIGTSSPSYNLHIEKSNASGNVDFLIRNSGTTSSSNTRILSFVSGASGGDPSIGVGITGVRDYFWKIDNSDGDKLNLVSNGFTRMTVDTAGNVMVGTTSTDMLGNNGLTLNPVGFLDVARNGNLSLRLTRKTTNGHIVDFRRDSTTVGYINVTTTGTSYVTSSDYRLKENVTDITDGIERVKQLNPARFNFIIDADTTVDGFLAHETATVVPEAVTGEKDAVDADGNPEYQGIDQAKLVPLLTAALQEAITKIEDLEARVATLEGN